MKLGTSFSKKQPLMALVMLLMQERKSAIFPCSSTFFPARRESIENYRWGRGKKVESDDYCRKNDDW